MESGNLPISFNRNMISEVYPLDSLVGYNFQIDVMSHLEEFGGSSYFIWSHSDTYLWKRQSNYVSMSISIIKYALSLLTETIPKIFRIDLSKA